MCIIKMRAPIKKLDNRQVSALDSSITFENFRFIKPKSLFKSKKNIQIMDLHKNLNFLPSKSLTNVQSLFTSSKNSKNINIKLSDFESNFTSISQAQKNTFRDDLKSVKTQWESNETSSKSVFSNVEDTTNYKSYDGNNSVLSVSTPEIKSDESFLTMMTRKKRKFEFINPKEKFPDFSKALRLFDKSGKPLTDRMGRPLVNILGQALVVLDSQGRLISDARGNQVFNTLGESAIYSSTNLYLSPSDEEPGIPLLDIDKKHILFLYDSKGHPLTDSLGRPLLKASGSLMIGMDPNCKINVSLYNENKLKSLYGKAPLENFVRRVQIFDSELHPLTDESGKVFEGAVIISNKNGMPLCDRRGYPLSFKYGSRISTPKSEDSNQQLKEIHEALTHEILQKSSDSVKLTNIDKNVNSYKGESKNNLFTSHTWSSELNANNQLSKMSTNAEQPHGCTSDDLIIKTNGISNKLKNSSTKQMENDTCVEKRKISNETIVIFDATKDKLNEKKSLINAAANSSFKSGQIGHCIKKRKPNKKVITTNFVEYFKNALNFKIFDQKNNGLTYNDYGKPMKDVYGNLLYDNFGIPLTGAKGRKLSEDARHTLRKKLGKIPVPPLNSNNTISEENKNHALTCNKSHDQFGNPYYDKYGRPFYDMYGNLIYDTYGRPLTDAYGRPLIDGLGQPLMDSQGNILTAGTNTGADTVPTDLFGRYLYDKNGRPLFDSYGRPRFDIFTNAIYDSCGRPATDGNGNVLFDFLNKPIQPYPENPLCRNPHASLPRFIDKILAMPSLRRLFKYPQASLKDIFGGPLFDDFGRPLYNRIGKPLYDKYGRPLYDKDGKPLCDCFGRPLSDEIRQSPDDQTLSVVDSLKLLKLTKESNKWMEVKRSQTHNLKATNSGIFNKSMIMMVVQPTKKKSTQYTYALTRITTFSCGRQALEILEAPLSPSTADEIHHLPVDNKPLIMMAKRRRKVTKKFMSTRHHC